MNSLRLRLRRSLTFVVGSGLLLALLLMAAAGPLLYPQGPWGMVGPPMTWPGDRVGLWLGTDSLGRDIMAGLLHGLCQPDAEPNSVAKPENLFRFAAGCGALVCLETGAIDPQPTVAEVERFIIAHGQS